MRQLQNLELRSCTPACQPIIWTLATFDFRRFSTRTTDFGSVLSAISPPEEGPWVVLARLLIGSYFEDN